MHSIVVIARSGHPPGLHSELDVGAEHQGSFPLRHGGLSLHHKGTLRKKGDYNVMTFNKEMIREQDGLWKYVFK